MGKLNVQLIVHPNCKLTAIDDNSWVHTPGHEGSLLENLTNYVSLEFLTDNVDKVLDETVIFQEFKHGRDNLLFDSEIPMFKDGVHYYYKMLIPKLDYLFVECGEHPNMYDSLYLKEQTFYYNGCFYYYLGDNIDLDVPTTKQELLEKYAAEIISKSEKLDYLGLYNKCGDQSFFCKKIVFSICKLVQCFVNLQKQILSKSTIDCAEFAELKNQRDFLFSTIYVLDYLKDINNYSEAQRILEQVTACNICDDLDLLNCGCHG